MIVAERLKAYHRQFRFYNVFNLHIIWKPKK